MNELLPYVQALERHLGAHHLSWMQWKPACESSLDGGAARELRQAVSLSAQRAQGAFFTSPSLADRAALALGVPSDLRHVYLDPTCGAGDLLLATARQLPLASTVVETLTVWGKHLVGYDICPVFVRATKARLALLAMHRTGDREPLTRQVLDSLFPSIKTANVLDHPSIYARSDRVIMNPPFVHVEISDDCGWTTGRTNAAACFAESAIMNAKVGTRMVAILPDVIRSGSRYERWRNMVCRNATVEEIDLYGSFDHHTDVDVFLLSATIQDITSQGDTEWTLTDSYAETVATRFKINVGSVVPHRDVEVGPQRPYVHVRSLSPWSTKDQISDRRRFSGRVFKPPFVAVRRTSSPRDRKRAIATIILGDQEVAVENHLIVCLPYDGSIESCDALMRRFRSSKTDDWFNGRIRCRHLTVTAVGGLPWRP